MSATGSARGHRKPWSLGLPGARFTCPERAALRGLVGEPKGPASVPCEDRLFVARRCRRPRKEALVGASVDLGNVGAGQTGGRAADAEGAPIGGRRAAQVPAYLARYRQQPGRPSPSTKGGVPSSGTSPGRPASKASMHRSLPSVGDSPLAQGPSLPSRWAAGTASAVHGNSAFAYAAAMGTYRGCDHAQSRVLSDLCTGTGPPGPFVAIAARRLVYCPRRPDCLYRT